MPAYKNVSDDTLTFNLNGNDPADAEVVEPGEIFTLSEKHAYVVGTLIAPGQVEKVDLNAQPTTPPAGDAK